MNMKLYKGKLDVSFSKDNDMWYGVISDTGERLPLSSNDVLLLKDTEGKPMSVIGPLPERVSVTDLRDLLGEYYPVFTQAAINSNPVELCKITLE